MISDSCEINSLYVSIKKMRGSLRVVPAALQKFVWKEPRNELEGIKFIIDSLPPHLKRRVKGYLPLTDLVPKTAKEVALIGQNLAGKLGVDEAKYQFFLKEISELLSYPNIEAVKLVMMTPRSLHAIHPEAAEDLRKFTYPRLLSLSKDAADRDKEKIEVILHPSATLSALAVDWSVPEKAFAFITPKFQRTSDIYGRVNILLDSDDVDSASISRLLYDGKKAGNHACASMLNEAPAILDQLLADIDL